MGQTGWFEGRRISGSSQPLRMKISQTSETPKVTAEKVIKTILRETHKRHSAVAKIRIVLSDLRGERRGPGGPPLSRQHHPVRRGRFVATCRQLVPKQFTPDHRSMLAHQAADLSGSFTAFMKSAKLITLSQVELITMLSHCSSGTHRCCTWNVNFGGRRSMATSRLLYVKSAGTRCGMNLKATVHDSFTMIAVWVRGLAAVRWRGSESGQRLGV